MGEISYAWEKKLKIMAIENEMGTAQRRERKAGGDDDVEDPGVLEDDVAEIGPWLNF